MISAAGLAIYGLMNGGFRSDAEWRRLSAELRARNEPLAFAEMVPPEVPADRNFFAAPVFAGVADGEPQAELFRKVAISVHGQRAGELLAASAGSDATPRLEPIAEAMAKDGLLDADYLLPADRIVAGMRKLGLAFDPLVEAAQLPDARFPLDYTRAFPPLRHLAHIEALGDWLAIDALSRLATGDGSSAATDVLLVGRLANSLASEPFLDSQRIRRQLLGLGAGCVRAGLSCDAFSGESLKEISAMLESVHLLEGFALAVRGERAALNSIVDGKLAADSPETAAPLMTWLGSAPEHLSRRDLRDLRTSVNAAAQIFLDQLSDPAGITPTALLPPSGTPVPERLPELAAEARLFEQVQAYVSQALLACALERFHITTGKYPSALDELLPEFLASLPPDPLTGRPPIYESDGTSFTLICSGWAPGESWTWKN